MGTRPGSPVTAGGGRASSCCSLAHRGTARATRGPIAVASPPSTWRPFVPTSAVARTLARLQRECRSTPAHQAGQKRLGHFRVRRTLPHPTTELGLACAAHRSFRPRTATPAPPAQLEREATDPLASTDGPSSRPRIRQKSRLFRLAHVHDRRVVYLRAEATEYVGVAGIPAPVVASCWPALEVVGQLSEASATVSLSSSRSQASPWLPRIGARGERGWSAARPLEQDTTPAGALEAPRWGQGAAPIHATEDRFARSSHNSIPFVTRRSAGGAILAARTARGEGVIDYERCDI